MHSSAALWHSSIQRNLARVSSYGLRGLKAINISLQRLMFGKRYFERPIHDYRLLLDSSDVGIHRQLLLRGRREPEQRFIVQRYLQPGMRAFDLGANIGYYTVMMAMRVGAGGRIYAVEPHPENYALLRENLARNQLLNVESENVAIDVRDGERELFVAERCNWHSFHDPNVRSDAPWSSHYRRIIKGPLLVKARGLQTYLEDKPSLDLLRMDLEGYEVEILEALSEMPVASTRKLHILFETHPEFYHPSKHDLRSVLERLHERHGYRVHYLVSDAQNGSRMHDHIERAQDVFERRGYDGAHILKMFDNRAIYARLQTEDALDLICTSENVHAAFLAPRHDQ